MTVPNTFQTGVPIRASDLNGNFTNLDTRVKRRLYGKRQNSEVL
jgi:hypothetical protein